MVPPRSNRVSRVRRYSGYNLPLRPFTYETVTLFGLPSQTIRLELRVRLTVRTPRVFLPAVWPPPRSLATTSGISVDVFSSPYLDVSVQAVPHVQLCIHCTLTELLSAGFPHSEIHGYNGCFRLTVAYRRSLRPSSAPSAKAFSLRPL